ncbi:MAG TPA: hypothetical protein VIA06_02400 [Candidatus Dormibacteraeota bacterium]|jgi:hypothetical protein|nr:hypothetical protein [Candidatus Dormibacteraeota bacterium]
MWADFRDPVGDRRPLQEQECERRSEEVERFARDVAAPYWRAVAEAVRRRGWLLER